MTHKEHSILTKAVIIAKENGFEISDDFFIDIKTQDNLLKDGDTYLNIIFNHEFAKCFWGDGLIQIGPQEEAREIDLVKTAETGGFPIAGLAVNEEAIQIPLWQYHLGQMVYRTNPIDYIEEAIDGALSDEEAE